MSRPVRIGRSYTEWQFLAPLVIAVCLVVCGTMLLIVAHPGGRTTIVAGGLAAFVAVVSALRIARTRFQIEITPDGFLVRNRHGEESFLDDQVICASLTSQPNYFNGALSSTTRTFDVWVENSSGARQVKMVNRLPVAAPDSLAPFIGRILDHLYERARAALEARQTFDGEGWSLCGNELVVGTRRSTTVPLEELAAVDVFDGDLCVWKHGQDEPVVRIPVDAANTQVLLRLLREKIAPPPEPGARPSGDRLGRILFERKPGKFTLVLLWLLPGAGLIGLAVVPLIALANRNPHTLLLGIPVVCLSAFFWALLLSQSVEFRVYEHGVRRRWLFRTRQLFYNQVDSFTYSAVKQYTKGVYTGTNFTLTFAARTGGTVQKLTYSRKLQNADSALDHLRDKISQLIADRMAAQFASGRSVMWTDGLRFFPEGLEYRASGFFGRKPPIVIPYSQIFGYDLNREMFWLWVRGRKKPVVRENLALPNFYPGYVFLQRLLTARPVAIG
jgi:hypothetical protein